MGDLMNDKRRVLGRGLDALLPSNRSAASAGTSAAAAVNGEANGNKGGVEEIPVALIEPNPFQTRGRVSEESLNELTASIQATGVIQPIVVRPLAAGKFQLIAGERRWLASRRAGKPTIPAMVRTASDAQAMEITIVENLQREDLNAIEQARAFERLSRDFGMTQEQMAYRTGKDRASVSNFLRLLKLPAEAVAAIEDGRISFGHGKVLLSLAHEPEATTQKLLRKVLAESLSVRQTEELAREWLSPSPRPAKPAAPAKDANVRAAESALQRTLRCKVEIRDRRGKGKIVLAYSSLEDFDRILEALGAAQ